MRLIDGLLLHQTGSMNDTVESIRRYHMQSLGWKDIGYHYVITRDGVAHKARPDAEVGAHCAGDNANTLGICCVGAGDAFPVGLGYMTLTMFESLLELIQTLRHSYPIKYLGGHREYSSGKVQHKSCPGYDVELLRKILGLSLG